MSGYADRQYENLLIDVLEHGTEKEDRTGTGTWSVFGRELRYDMRQGFPLVTSKRVHFDSVVGELLWMLSGSTNANELREKYGVTIWDEWADEDGELGPVYGKQWRNWGGEGCYDGQGGYDQIATVIDSIKNDPSSRRHIVSAWNVADIPDMALAPCHAFFQFNVADGFLDLKLTQRSADMFLGVPFNIASYALLLHMVAAQTQLEPRNLIWSGGDVHIYQNHEHAVVKQLSRPTHPFPTLVLDTVGDIFSYTTEDIHLLNYVHEAPISAPVAV